jgi:hypothetical protein
MANISHGDVVEAILTSSQQNVGEDIASDQINHVSSLVTVAASVGGLQEEDEVRRLLGHPLKDFLLKLPGTIQEILMKLKL